MRTILLLSVVFLFGACDNCEDVSRNYDAQLFASYSNPENGQPTLEVDLSSSSEEINVELNPTVTSSSGRFLLRYSGVTFKEDKDVFRIDDVRSERKNNSDCWVIDDENKLNWEYSKSLDIVLVVDVSSSLGANINAIKDNAQQMISNILIQNPEARIAIVKFSRGNVSTSLISDENTLVQFISQNTSFNSPDIGSYDLEGRNETALYEAINEAIEILNNSDARGKGILTFTDGLSNFQFDANFQNATSIIDALNNSNISSYTIGYEGNQGSVERSILQQVAVNGDFSFPESIEDLQEVFEIFSNSVAAVYDLIYDTNNANFNTAIEYRFLFKTTKVSK